jgi:dihydrolipoamide dehydrogenase
MGEIKSGKDLTFLIKMCLQKRTFMAKNFDVVVLGAGPGGYVAAIRASQLGQKVAIVEGQHMGGVCLNKGCIPTKALLKSAHSAHEIADFKNLGINVKLESLDGTQAVNRANQIADRISKGVSYLMKKNKIEVFFGFGKFKDKNTLVVGTPNGDEIVSGKKIIIATGANYRTFPGLEHNGKNLIGAWEAVKLNKLPKSIGIVGAGAIGVEFAYFWNAFGVDVHIFEMQDRLLPIEDNDSSKEVEKHYKKYGVKLSLGVEKVSAKDNGKDVTITCVNKGKEETYTFEKGLIAVGMTGNVDSIGLDKIGVKVERGFIAVNEMYQTKR